jgi:hypothetical protein
VKPVPDFTCWSSRSWGKGCADERGDVVGVFDISQDRYGHLAPPERSGAHPDCATQEPETACNSTDMLGIETFIVGIGQVTSGCA